MAESKAIKEALETIKQRIEMRERMAAQVNAAKKEVDTAEETLNSAKGILDFEAFTQARRVLDDKKAYYNLVLKAQREMETADGADDALFGRLKDALMDEYNALRHVAEKAIAKNVKEMQQTLESYIVEQKYISDLTNQLKETLNLQNNYGYFGGSNENIRLNGKTGTLYEAALRFLELDRAKH